MLVEKSGKELAFNEVTMLGLEAILMATALNDSREMEIKKRLDGDVQNIVTVIVLVLRFWKQDRFPTTEVTAKAWSSPYRFVK